MRLGWPRFLKQMAREGDLLAGALTNVPPDPAIRAQQIVQRLGRLRREEAALKNELLSLGQLKG